MNTNRWQIIGCAWITLSLRDRHTSRVMEFRSPHDCEPPAEISASLLPGTMTVPVLLTGFTLRHLDMLQREPLTSLFPSCLQCLWSFILSLSEELQFQSILSAPQSVVLLIYNLQNQS